MKGIEYAHSVTKARFNRVVAKGAITPMYLGVSSLLHTMNPVFGAEIITQSRVGQNGQTFELNKFSQFGLNGDQASRFLSLLRALGADELPQCMNVATGDMLTTGFRPLIPEEHDEFMDSLPPALQQRHDKVVLPTLPGLISSHGIASHSGLVRGTISSTAVERAERNIQDVVDGSITYDATLIARYLGSPLLAKLMKSRTAKQCKEKIGKGCDAPRT